MQFHFKIEPNGSNSRIYFAMKERVVEYDYMNESAPIKTVVPLNP